MQKLKNNIFLGGGFVLLGILYFFWIIFQNRTLLFRPYNPIQAEKTFSESQWNLSQNISEDKVLDEWAIKNKYTGWKNFIDENKSKINVQTKREQIIRAIQDKGVSDSFLYGYTGYKYVTGTNPSLLNPEHPPLAKYLIGYSILTFGNEHMVGIGVGFLTLLLIFIISYQIHGSYVFAGLSLFFASIFPLFSDQIVNGPQLELYQLFFFLLLVHFLLMAQAKKKSLFTIAAGIAFGLLLSVKTVVPFFLLFGVWLTITFMRQWKKIIMIFGIGIITFAFTYYQYFVLGGSLRSFLGLQKYIVTFYGNAHIPLLEFAGNYLRLIFTGSWKFWNTARSVSFYQGWNIMWPLVFIAGLVRMKILWKKNSSANLLIIFLILYNLFVFITPIFPRYLLLLFVPMIILL
jgi:hypothetical protein